ncbi:MAG: c-type cytochrome [Sulfuricaulis sp.]
MLKTHLLFPALITLSVSAQAATLPGNAEQGKKLHDAKCMSCHNDSVYTRKDRHVTSLKGLHDQVGACGHMADVTLGKTQVDDLVKYLNQNFYKFK